MSDHAFATDEFIHAQIAAWHRELGAIRRLAPKTLDAYGRDLDQFMTFLASHMGGPVSLQSLKDLRGADIRAFMARRRSESLGSRSLARILSALRSFFAFLEREGIIATEALNAVRTPKIPRTLPKALTVIEAKKTIDTAGALEERPWVAARDMAVIALCYGAGLRISEALALTRADLEADLLRVTGKGGKVRMVPLIASVRQTIDAYLGLCPFALAKDEPLFRGIRGGVLKA